MEKQIFDSLRTIWNEIVPDKSPAEEMVFLKVQSKLTRNGCIVAMILDEKRREPVAIVKIPRNPYFTAHIEAEVRAAEVMHGGRFDKDVRHHTPAAAKIVSLSSQKILLQSVCGGESMVKSMVSQDEVIRLSGPVTSWLVRMQRQGGESATLTGELLDEKIVKPVADVQAQHPELFAALSEKSKQYFRDLPGRVAGKELKLVPQHGDLNAHNIVIRQGHPDGFSIIDWEDFRENHLPVNDLAHFFISNSKIIEPGGTAAANFKKFVLSDGWYRDIMKTAVKAMADAGIIAEALFYELVPLYLLAFCLRVSEEGRQQQHTAGVWMDRVDQYISHFK